MSTSRQSSSSRTVRVFLSSTFRDFAEERDLLVRKIFPELRRKCRERQVELVDVDLRWGITEEQAQRGEVLPICLAEIDRSRPYFMGFIGDRYGWVPEHHQYDISLLVEQPWLDDHRGGKSVTELEMLHGVLNNPQMAGRAFFYFRNSEYSQSRGGDFVTTDPEEKKRLESLKECIRGSGFPVLENYPNPEELAEKVQEDLWKVIDEAFPLGKVPSPEEKADQHHLEFANSRLVGYVSRPSIWSAITDHFECQRAPLVVMGEPGTGKSSILAEWMLSLVKKASEDKKLIWYHAIGGAPDSAAPLGIQRRLMKWLIGLGYMSPEALRDDTKYTQNITIALGEACASGKKVILIIDSLDQQLGDELDWIPIVLPEGLDLLLSSQHGRFDDVINARKWSILEVDPLNRDEVKAVAEAFLQRFSKRFSLEEMDLLMGFPPITNPLFLRTLLDELRLVGRFGDLDEQIRDYGSCENVTELFAAILARLENDFGRDFVALFFGLIGASDKGLAESELQRLLGSNEKDGILPQAKLAPLLGSLYEALTWKTGYITFFHGALATAVQKRYVQGREIMLNLTLGNYFRGLEKESRRRLSEEAYHWQTAAEYGDEKAKETLISLIGEFSYPYEKTHQGLLEECADDYEGAASLDSSRMGKWWHFMRYRLPTLRHPGDGVSQHQMLLQMALEDGEDSPITAAARKWLRMCPSDVTVASVLPTLRAYPDPYEAHYRHPLCPAPKDLRGHSSWISGWVQLDDGDVITWSRDPFLLRWSPTSDRPIEKIPGFRSGTLGAIDFDGGALLIWGFDAQASIFSPGIDEPIPFTLLPKTIEGARKFLNRTIVWDLDGNVALFSSGEEAEIIAQNLGVILDVEAGEEGVSVSLLSKDPVQIPIDGGALEVQSGEYADVYSGASVCYELSGRESVPLESSGGNCISWHSRSWARAIQSYPESDLHLILNLTSMVPVRTYDLTKKQS
jgi:hypothetical protein